MNFISLFIYDLLFNQQYIDKLISNFKVPNSTGGPSREVWIFLSPSWPQQCSPLSTGK